MGIDTSLIGSPWHNGQTGNTGHRCPHRAHLPASARRVSARWLYPGIEERPGGSPKGTFILTTLEENEAGAVQAKA